MRTQKVDAYNSRPTSGVSNEYPTPPASFKQPALHIIQGVRNSGKSYLASQILEQAHRDKTFDVVYIITPSFLSNKAYFGKYIREEDVFEPRAVASKRSSSALRPTETSGKHICSSKSSTSSIGAKFTRTIFSAITSSWHTGSTVFCRGASPSGNTETRNHPEVSLS
jgi:hypothetical protein